LIIWMRMKHQTDSGHLVLRMKPIVLVLYWIQEISIWGTSILIRTCLDVWWCVNSKTWVHKSKHEWGALASHNVCYQQCLLAALPKPTANRQHQRLSSTMYFDTVWQHLLLLMLLLTNVMKKQKDMCTQTCQLWLQHFPDSGRLSSKSRSSQIRPTDQNEWPKSPNQGRHKLGPPIKTNDQKVGLMFFGIIVLRMNCVVTKLSTLLFFNVNVSTSDVENIAAGKLHC
jgi:hypothetical protein